MRGEPVISESKDRLKVNQIDVSYGRKKVVDQVSFSLKEGQIGCLLGPSGCGKTTVLLTIAGFHRPQQGQISINDAIVSNGKIFVPPEKRQVGMVFQDYALFPNLTVENNIRFGIKSLEKSAQNARIDELLELVGMRELATSFPHQLSGGQQQRVALARAMAPRPSVLLLDEPFSNLDVELREQLATEVRQILKQENVTAILVTHDQLEAFAMADDICVMHEGRIQQQDSAINLYRTPVNQFVAGFIGEGVLIEGEIAQENLLRTDLGEISIDSHQPGKVDVLVRPNDIMLDHQADLRATIINRTYRGSVFLYELMLPSGVKVLGQSPSEQRHDVGSEIGVIWQPSEISVFDRL